MELLHRFDSGVGFNKQNEVLKSDNMVQENQLSEEQAKSLYDSGLWKAWTADQVVKFQLFQDRLCVEFSHFHKCITEVLGRSVFTHEFAYRDELIKEYLGEKTAPSFDEILNLIPAEKRIIIGL